MYIDKCFVSGDISYIKYIYVAPVHAKYCVIFHWILFIFNCFLNNSFESQDKKIKSKTGAGKTFKRPR